MSWKRVYFLHLACHFKSLKGFWGMQACIIALSYFESF